jgi:hypothetical protein
MRNRCRKIESNLSTRKILCLAAALGFSVHIAGPVLSTPAHAFATCAQLKSLLRKFRAEGNQAGVDSILGPDGHGMDYTCSGQLDRDLQAARNGTFEDSEGFDTALGVLGIVGGFAARGGRPMVVPRRLSHQIRINKVGGVVGAAKAAAPIVSKSGANALKASTVNTSTRSAVQTAKRKQPIGYITQPDGTKDPYYTNRPCATVRQTGPTSYACTN